MCRLDRAPHIVERGRPGMSVVWQRIAAADPLCLPALAHLSAAATISALQEREKQSSLSACSPRRGVRLPFSSVLASDASSHNVINGVSLLVIPSINRAGLYSGPIIRGATARCSSSTARCSSIFARMIARRPVVHKTRRRRRRGKSPSSVLRGGDTFRRKSEAWGVVRR